MPPATSTRSLGALPTQAIASLKRFPLVIAVAVVCAAATMGIIDRGGGGDADALVRLLAAATLGLPLLTALAVTAERRPGLRGQALAALVGLAALVAFYAAWPSWTDTERLYHYVQLSLAFHLCAAVLPFVGLPLHRAFWQYNRRLLERFIFAAVFSAVIFLGLALALAAVDQLLGVHIEEQAYGRVWAVMAFVVSTWIFLSGVPTDIPALEASRDYPRVLQVLAARILVPLVSLYIVILLLYLLRVVATRVWPSGWIGWLVSALGVTGTLALLLVAPIARDEAERWVARFARVYWIAVLPAVLMLWLAIRQRVAQYGFTEDRYAVLVLSIWLFGIAVFYTVRRSSDMRIIPASLAVVALATLAGPWGAFPVSFRSQYHRLEATLAANGMLANGKLGLPTRAVPNDDRREIAAALQYLVTAQGPVAVTQWMDAAGVQADSVVNQGPPWRAGVRLADFLGVPPRDTTARARNFEAANEPAVAVAGYDLLIQRIQTRRTAADTGYIAIFQAGRQAVRIQHGVEVLMTLPLDTAVRRATADTARGGVSPIVVHGAGGGWQAALRITKLSNADTAGRFRGIEGTVLLKRVR